MPTIDPSTPNRRAPLARGVDGEPFTVPPDASSWRVRRFRNPGQRGACELVYGDDAAPLEIAIDTPIGEFREIVGNRAGRYRLDAIDFDGVNVPKVVPAYLQIENAEAARASHAPTVATPADPMLEIMREMMATTRDLARTNAELARTVIERFPAMIDSAAALVRAADGAGLPHRAPHDPRNASAPVLNDNQADDDEDDEIVMAGWPATVKSVVNQLVPMVQMVIAHRMGGAAPRNADNAPRPLAPSMSAPTAAGPVAPTARGNAESTSSDAGSNGGQDPPGFDTVSNGTKARRESALTPTADQLAHFAAIQVALTPREGQIARALVAELRPGEVAAWLRELCALAVPDAVALIRHHLAQTAPPAPPATTEAGIRKPDSIARTPDASDNSKT